MNENFLVFKGDAPPELNHALIDSKIKDLKGLSSFMDQFLRLIQKMIAKKNERISLDDLMSESEKLSSFKEPKME